jgi:hypothetical protein
MNDFQWNKTDVEWFVDNFKNGTDEIGSRIVHQKYRRWKKTDVKSLDCKNLMRLVVHHKLARVVKSHATSHKYRIKMVANDYPYIQDFFDGELFIPDNPSYLLQGIEKTEVDEIITKYPRLGIEEWNESCQEQWSQSTMLGQLYFNAFVAYNLLGGDFDKVFIHQSSPEINPWRNFTYETIPSQKIVISQRDSFCLMINSFRCYYRLFKLAIPNLTSICSRYGVVDIPYTNHNLLFMDFFNSMILLNFYQGMLHKKIDKLGANRTRYNKIREILEYFKEGNLVSIDNDFDPDDELIGILRINFFWLHFSLMSNDSTIRAAVNECIAAYLAVTSSLADGLRKS